MQGYSNIYGVRIYTVVNYLTAALSWFLFFTFRKIIELGREGFELASVLSDQKLYVGVALIPLGWLFLYFLLERTSDIYRQSRVTTFIRTGGITLLGTLILLFTVLIDDVFLKYDTYLRSFLALFTIHFLVTALGRMVVLSYFKSLIRKGKVFYNTLVLGSAKEVDYWSGLFLKEKKQLGYRVTGCLTEPGANLSSVSVLGTYPDLYTTLQEGDFGEVILADKSISQRDIDNVIEVNSQFDDNHSLKLIPELYDMISGRVRVNNVYGLTLIELEQKVTKRWESAIKRLMDVSVSIVALILLLPFIIYIAIKVKLSSPGPILFAQTRVGKNGKPFMIYKFRSMHEGAEEDGPQLSHDNDDRCTKWGAFMRKWRIDEIPQFINVLKGEMSLVGPRPERQYYIDQLMKIEPRIKKLLKVQPGITSLGQVKYGYASSIEEMLKRLKFDLIYLENKSIVLDIKILFYTLIVLLQGKGK